MVAWLLCKKLREQHFQHIYEEHLCAWPRLAKTVLCFHRWGDQESPQNSVFCPSPWKVSNYCHSELFFR
jgi:hypothetical protein